MKLAFVGEKLKMIRLVSIGLYLLLLRNLWQTAILATMQLCCSVTKIDGMTQGKLLAGSCSSIPDEDMRKSGMSCFLARFNHYCCHETPQMVQLITLPPLPLSFPVASLFPWPLFVACGCL